MSLARTERLRSTALTLLLRACGGAVALRFWGPAGGQGALYCGRPLLVVSSSSGSPSWTLRAAITSRSDGLRVRQPQLWPSTPSSSPGSSSTVMKASPQRLSQRSRPCWYIWPTKHRCMWEHSSSQTVDQPDSRRWQFYCGHAENAESNWFLLSILMTQNTINIHKQ